MGLYYPAKRNDPERFCAAKTKEGQIDVLPCLRMQYDGDSYGQKR